MAIKFLSQLEATGNYDLASGDIPNLAASKITSGTFSTARIPNISASKITSGTLNASRLPTVMQHSVTAIGSSTDYIGINKDSSNYISFYIDGNEVGRLKSNGDLHIKGDVIAVSGELNA